MDTRADIDVEDLLKIILVLVIVWIVIEILAEFVSALLGPFQPLLGLLIVVLIVLYFLDRL